MKIKLLLISVGIAGMLGLGAISAAHLSAAHANQAAGYLDKVEVAGNTFVASGWAADLSSRDKQVSVILFDGDAATGEVIGHSVTSLPRLDVNNYLREAAGIRRRGFIATLDRRPENPVHAYIVLTNGNLESIGSVRVTETPVATKPTPSTTPMPDNAGEWVRGNLSTAKIVMIEYSDIQCPFCQRIHPTLASIKEEYGEDVAWVFKHFPLSMHPEARPAALAAECAGEQTGDQGFFAYLDALFEQQSRLGREFYLETAARLPGVDMEKFKTCIEEERYANKIESDHQEGLAAAVNGTPTTFVNNEKIVGSVPKETFTTLIDRLLTK